MRKEKKRFSFRRAETSYEVSYEKSEFNLPRIPRKTHWIWHSDYSPRPDDIRISELDSICEEIYFSTFLENILTMLFLLTANTKEGEDA